MNITAKTEMCVFDARIETNGVIVVAGYGDYNTDKVSNVILHLTYGLQVLNRVRQQPMQLSQSIPI